MKAVELVKISSEAMKVMSDCGIKVSDWEFVEMYEEFVEMRRRQEKFRYVVAVLAERYKVSESTVRRVVGRMSREVKV